MAEKELGYTLESLKTFYTIARALTYANLRPHIAIPEEELDWLRKALLGRWTRAIALEPRGQDTAVNIARTMGAALAITPPDDPLREKMRKDIDEIARNARPAEQLILFNAVKKVAPDFFSEQGWDDRYDWFRADIVERLGKWKWPRYRTEKDVQDRNLRETHSASAASMFLGLAELPESYYDEELTEMLRRLNDIDLTEGFKALGKDHRGKRVLPRPLWDLLMGWLSRQPPSSPDVTPAHLALLDAVEPPPESRSGRASVSAVLAAARAKQALGAEAKSWPRVVQKICRYYGVTLGHLEAALTAAESRNECKAEARKLAPRKRGWLF